MSKYPVGATWEGEEVDHIGTLGGNQHRKATIWLEKRDGKFEMWMYSWCYQDGTSEPGSFDWGTNYQNVRNQIPFYCRLRRVK